MCQGSPSPFFQSPLPSIRRTEPVWARTRPWRFFQFLTGINAEDRESWSCTAVASSWRLLATLIFQNGVILNVSKNLPHVVRSGRCRVNARCRFKRSSRRHKSLCRQLCRQHGQRDRYLHRKRGDHHSGRHWSARHGDQPGWRYGLRRWRWAPRCSTSSTRRATASPRLSRSARSPTTFTLTPDGKLLLVTVYGEDRIAIVDTATKDVVGTIPVAKPHGSTRLGPARR